MRGVPPRGGSPAIPELLSQAPEPMTSITIPAGLPLRGVSPALRAGASDFGKTQSHQRSFPPPTRPLRGFPRVGHKVGRTAADGASLPRCGCAIIPDGAPDLASSPRRLAGGQQYRARLWRRRLVSIVALRTAPTSAALNVVRVPERPSIPIHFLNFLILLWKPSSRSSFPGFTR